jgi:hypothetical protein
VGTKAPSSWAPWGQENITPTTELVLLADPQEHAICQELWAKTWQTFPFMGPLPRQAPLIQPPYLKRLAELRPRWAICLGEELAQTLWVGPLRDMTVGPNGIPFLLWPSPRKAWEHIGTYQQWCQCALRFWALQRRGQLRPFVQWQVFHTLDEIQRQFEQWLTHRPPFLVWSYLAGPSGPRSLQWASEGPVFIAPLAQPQGPCGFAPEDLAPHIQRLANCNTQHVFYDLRDCLRSFRTFGPAVVGALLKTLKLCSSHPQAASYGQGFDVLLAAHACYEEEPTYSLEGLARTYAAWPEDIWSGSLSSQRGPMVAAHRAAAIRELYQLYQNHLLDRDLWGNRCRHTFLTALGATRALAEAEQTGLLLDASRAWRLVQDLQQRCQRYQKQLRQAFHWPALDPQDPRHCRLALYGGHLPVGAQSLNLPGPPRLDKETLQHHIQGLQAAGQEEKAQLVHQLQQYLQLQQQLSVLVGKKGTAGGQKRGLLRWVEDDGRTYFRLDQTTKTRRCCTRQPNVQSLSKYQGPSLRSLFRARPDHVLIEADYQSAELLLAALCANDQRLLQDYKRMALPETDPDHSDIYAQMAVWAFGLPCAPTKKGLQKIGKLPLRQAAKTVVFGILYGMSPGALTQTLAHQCPKTTLADAIRLYEIFWKQYPQVQEFMHKMHERVVDPGWVSTNYSYRRFLCPPGARPTPYMLRAAANFPIQGGVADALLQALTFWGHAAERYRPDGSVRARLVLPIHDAFLVEAPEAELRWLLGRPNEEGFLERALVKAAPLWPQTSTGQHRGDGPYHFQLHVNVYRYWDKPLTREERRQLQERWGPLRWF